MPCGNREKGNKRKTQKSKLTEGFIGHSCLVYGLVFARLESDLGTAEAKGKGKD